MGKQMCAIVHGQTNVCNSTWANRRVTFGFNTSYFINSKKTFFYRQIN